MLTKFAYLTIFSFAGHTVSAGPEYLLFVHHFCMFEFSLQTLGSAFAHNTFFMSFLFVQAVFARVTVFFFALQAFVAGPNNLHYI